MGYKLAGYDVIGNVEIDPRVMAIYQANNHPKYPYLMDVRDFLKVEDLPEELFHLDILDGSPPCSVFSTVGKREKGWDKEKVFREGQARQKLDDLFFWFIQIAERLQPKVVIAENVSGLLKGNAKGYANEIFRAFDAAGYKTQLFLLNAAFMGVPQRRERCFFIAQRKDQNYQKLKLQFKEEPIKFGDVRTGKGVFFQKELMAQLAKEIRKGDKDFSDVSMRVRGKYSMFTNSITWDDEVCVTIRGTGVHTRGFDKSKFAKGDFVNVSTFPQDYDFCDQQPQYICGMSVPPVMMAQVASKVYEQWLRRCC